MTEKKEKVIDVLIEQIKQDIIDGDVTVLAELLSFLPYNTLVNSLSDEQMVNFKL
jgi:hypothetical protein